MGIGYTLGTARRNKLALASSGSSKKLGVQLGKLCIRNDISVAYIASELGISRPTVYNWFLGYTNPSASLTPSVSKLLTKLKARS
jgi:DNA-binding XRE family transcriptional regulator